MSVKVYTFDIVCITLRKGVKIKTRYIIISIRVTFTPNYKHPVSLKKYSTDIYNKVVFFWGGGGGERRHRFCIGVHKSLLYTEFVQPIM